MTHAETVFYLYCVAPGGAPLELSQAGVFVDVSGPLRAVLSEVRREEFLGPEAEEHLKELAWLAPRAALHEAVLEQAMAQSPVLPAPFATLFESHENVRRFLDRHRDPISAFFRDLGSKREWAVKGLLHRALPGGEPWLAPGQDSPGKSYLGKKREQASQKRSTRQQLRTACEHSVAELREQAQAFRERRVWKAGTADGQPELIFNWAFLIPPSDEAAFRRTVSKLDEQHRALGLSLVISGPWPPYSFAPALAME